MTTAHDKIVQVFAQLEKMPKDQITTVILVLENPAAHVPPVANMGAPREPWLEACRAEMQPIFDRLDTFAAKHGLARHKGSGATNHATFTGEAGKLLALRDAPHLRGIMLDAPLRLVR